MSVTDTEWGRVDDSGTVWVRTAEGEREVGSYPGATPEEALAYFRRKFDELNGQVRLLEQRIKGPGMPAAEATSSIEKLRDSVTNARAVGDLAALLHRLDALAPVVAERKAAQDEAKEKARAAELARKEDLVAEAETLSTSTSWKATGDRLRVLLEEWKAAPRLERKVDDALWKRFSAARGTFDRNRRHHFSNLDAQRGEAKASKEKLVAEAESLSGSTDWGPTSSRYRDLMSEWKAAPRAGKGDEDAAWARFRGAQDTFFTARAAVFDERDSEQRDNLTAKTALVVEAEAILPVRDLAAARSALRTVQERWEGVGHVPRDARPALEARLHAVESAIRGAEETQWKRSNPEAHARSQATVHQLETALAKLEKQRDAAVAAGSARKQQEAEASIQARREWLVEARRVLSEYDG